MRRALWLAAAGVFTAAVVGLSLWLWWRQLTSGADRAGARVTATPPPVGVDEASTHIERRYSAAPAGTPKPTPPPAPRLAGFRHVAPQEGETRPRGSKDYAPVRFYTAPDVDRIEQVAFPAATPTPAASADADDPPERAPYGRMVRCHLIATINSGLGNEVPLVGMVDQDCTGDFGEIIIPRCSEVHGTVVVGKARDRVFSEGPFTFILKDRPRPGQRAELVVTGMAMDREEAPEYRAYGISNGSPGLMGNVVKQWNAAEWKLFGLSFMSGAVEAARATSTTAFGVVTDPSARGAGGVPGWAINPAVGGIQAILDRYAQQIADAIQRDGYFIQVPSNKEFMVYVRDTMFPSKATLNGNEVRRQVRDQYLEDRRRDEDVTRPRELREQRLNLESANGNNDQASSGGAAGQSLTASLNRLTQQMGTQTQALDAQRAALQRRLDALGTPDPATVPTVPRLPAPSPAPATNTAP
jgi:hypothetical protein